MQFTVCAFNEESLIAQLSFHENLFGKKFSVKLIRHGDGESTGNVYVLDDGVLSYRVYDTLFRFGNYGIVRIANFPLMDEYQVWKDGVKIGSTNDSLEYAKVIMSRDMQYG